MAARRHLPVLQATSKPTSEPEAPAWHWIPLGSAVSLAALIPAAPLMLSLMRATLSLAYRANSSGAELARARAETPVRAAVVELLAVAVPTLTLLLCVALGGYVLGRRGARTNPRHGVLSGACTALLCGALSRSLVATLLLVPLAMLVGGAAARVGVSRRDRDEG